METLRKAYALAKNNDGAPGVDGVTLFARITTTTIKAGRDRRSATRPRRGRHGKRSRVSARSTSPGRMRFLCAGIPAT